MNKFTTGLLLHGVKQAITERTFWLHDFGLSSDITCQIEITDQIIREKVKYLSSHMCLRIHACVVSFIFI